MEVQKLKKTKAEKMKPKDTEGLIRRQKGHVVMFMVIDCEASVVSFKFSVTVMSV